ncbi:MAG: lysylphosphatidylglycerol synthase transmembrane domain-containing protein [Dehalococcoidia bacterium]
MSQFTAALDAFLDYLSAIEWMTLALGLAIHLVRFMVRAQAWRNILRAAYPDSYVPYRGTFGAYIAGIGVNSIVPARGGDILKIVLAKRGVEGSTYSTVAASLVPETLFDFFVVGGIMIWALTQGVAPSLDTLSRLPTIDWNWLLNHPAWSLSFAALGVAVAIGAVTYGARRVQHFWDRVSQGFAIFERPSRYVTHVAALQAVGWLCRVAAIYCFLLAFDVPATLGNALLVIAVQSASTVLPATPGGMGTQQGLLVYVFRGVPVSRTALLSFSVGMNLVLTAFNAAIGFAAILIMLRTLRWRHATRSEAPGAQLGSEHTS